MLAHHARLGVRSLRRRPVLTALIVLTLGVGVAASMTTLTVLRAMSADPVPGKSDRLVTPLLDVRPDDGRDGGPDPPLQLTYRDAVALKAAGAAPRQTAVYRMSAAITPEREGLAPFFGDGLAVHRDFFPMMEVPFVAGGPWSEEDDRRGGHVIVLRESMAERLFGEADPVGRTLLVGTSDHVVTGVVSDGWEPMPKYYRIVSGPPPYAGVEDIFLPFETAVAAEIPVQGTTSCYGPSSSDGFEGLKRSECVWILYWAELASASDAPAYRDSLAAHVAEQRRAGRFPRPDNHRLHDVTSWIAYNEVVPRDSRLQAWLAAGFLLACVVNTVGLLLAKFTARGAEIGVRRALGARRSTIFEQHLVESGVLGAAGGLAGLLLTAGFLHALSRQAEELAVLARLDGVMLAVTLAVSVLSAVVAGLLPTWRACLVDPALQVKAP